MLAMAVCGYHYFEISCEIHVNNRSYCHSTCINSSSIYTAKKPWLHSLSGLENLYIHEVSKSPVRDLWGGG